MANEEQLSILKQGVGVWNNWRDKNRTIDIDLSRADLKAADLSDADLEATNLTGTILSLAILTGTILNQADLSGTDLSAAILWGADLTGTDLSKADLSQCILRGADLLGSKWSKAIVDFTIFADSDLSQIIGLEDAKHEGPSSISTDTFILSKGRIPEVFLRGCGLSDWEIEAVKLYNPDLSNQEINDIQYRMYDLRATQALQISPLFISYSHANGEFVDKVGDELTKKGIRYWRDIKDLKSGRVEKQLDRAVRQNPTVLLVLSEHSLKSDWVEHEVRAARELEKEMARDVLCPVALDDSWKSSAWPKRVMEQIMEYNILDFSAWEDDSKFDSIFRKLIDGLELFYKE